MHIYSKMMDVCMPKVEINTVLKNILQGVLQKTVEKWSFLTVGGAFDYVIITVMSCKVLIYHLARFAWSCKILARMTSETCNNNMFCKKLARKVQDFSFFPTSAYECTCYRLQRPVGDESFVREDRQLLRTEHRHGLGLHPRAGLPQGQTGQLRLHVGRPHPPVDEGNPPLNSTQKTCCFLFKNQIILSISECSEVNTFIPLQATVMKLNGKIKRFLFPLNQKHAIHDLVNQVDILSNIL